MARMLSRLADWVAVGFLALVGAAAAVFFLWLCAQWLGWQLTTGLFVFLGLVSLALCRAEKILDRRKSPRPRVRRAGSASFFGPL